MEDFRSRRAPRGRAELPPLARAPSVLRATSAIPGRLAPVRPASLHPGREARPAPAAARTRRGGRVSPVGPPGRLGRAATPVPGPARGRPAKVDGRSHPANPAAPVNPVEKGSASGHDTPHAPRRGRTIGRSRRSQARVRATSTVTRRRVSQPRRPIHSAAGPRPTPAWLDSFRPTSHADSAGHAALDVRSASGHDTPPAPRRGRTISRSRGRRATLRATSTHTRRHVAQPRATAARTLHRTPPHPRERRTGPTRRPTPYRDVERASSGRSACPSARSYGP